MRKLKLDLVDVEDLQVDSFETTAIEAGRGTVRGNETETATCENTCANTCAVTCDPAGTSMTDCWGGCGPGSGALQCWTGSFSCQCPETLVTQPYGSCIVSCGRCPETQQPDVQSCVNCCG